MILALLIGCLTPEAFFQEHLTNACAYYVECDGGPEADEGCEPAHLADLAAASAAACSTWDATAAQACLDVEQGQMATCDPFSRGCDFDAFCYGE